MTIEKKDERPAGAANMEQVLFEVKKIIVGQDHLLERLLVALLARGHILVEGVPGLAKTMAIKTLAQSIGGKFQRIQFTPDLVPADLVGTRIYNQKNGEFQTSLGPVFANLLLADEINRAPAKVQSALLEVMQERQVTIGRETFKVPDPFLVMATQNPIETDGTYPLPEAQVDRFMMKVLVDYPSEREEFVIVERMTGTLLAVQKVLSTDQLLDLQQQAARVYVDPALIEYAIRIVTTTRDPKSQGLDDAGHEVIAPQDASALNLVRLVKEFSPDVIISDVLMPVMDGFAVCRRLREREATRLVPVIVLTALTAIEDRVKLLEHGADDVLTKPVDERELVARIQGALARKRELDHRLGDLARVRDHFAKFVPAAVRRLVLANPDAPGLDKHERDVTVLFVDISGYGRLAESVAPADLTALVERYFGSFLGRL